MSIRLSIGIAASLLVAAGCSSSSSDDMTFKDSSGRTCTVDVSTAEMVATCNVSPMGTCDPGSTDLFEFTLDTVIVGSGSDATATSTPAICEVCADAADDMSTIMNGTCATITCTTQADCFYSTSTCNAGLCGPVGSV